MTAQYEDQVIFNNDQYALSGWRSGNLFHPRQFGLQPGMTSTACYRGFICTYEISDDSLFLQELLTSDQRKIYPPVNGVDPKPVIRRYIQKDKDGEWREKTETVKGVREYSDIELLIPYTGILRIAKDLVSSQHINMGFQKPSAYKTVFDLFLFKGQVSEITDRSKEMEERRGEFKKKYESGPYSKTIRDAFLRDIDLI